VFRVQLLVTARARSLYKSSPQHSVPEEVECDAEL